MLTLATLDRGIRLLGQPSAYDGLFRRLHASKPITIAVLGASVGQNAGCLTQPGKRCMLYGGERGVGFAVRLLQEVNGTWPHQEHRIVNAALDGTGAEHAARCLVSHLPARLDLVLAEWGSMAMHTIWAAHSIERVARTLLARANPPVLLHLSVHEWCSQRISPRAIYRVGDVLKGNLRQYVYPDSPWAAVDDECARVARHYGHSALSVHAMLAPHVIAHSGDDGFALDDITGADCLHPTNGRHGVAYIAQLLSHWLRRVRELWQHAQTPSGQYLLGQWMPPGIDIQPDGLPAPLHAVNARHTHETRCYAFVHLPSTRGQLIMTPVDWCSVAPSAVAVLKSGRRVKRRNSAVGTASAVTPSACWQAKQQTCPPELRAVESVSSAPSMTTVPGQEHSKAALAAFMRHPPSTWFYCGVALGHARTIIRGDTAIRRKLSAGLVALRPGAQLRARVDPLGASLAEVHVEHLTSYEGMGMVQLDCAEGCACASQTIDAHTVANDLRNVSVYETYTFTARRTSAAGRGRHTSRALPCELLFTLLNRSNSDGTKFKLRSLTVRTVIPNATAYRRPP